MDAYTRTLRDIHSGHIGIYAAVDWYDADTGEPLAEPIIRGVGADRAPAHGVGNPAGSWWEPMIEAGHLALFGGHGRSFYQVTDAGVEWLHAHGA